MVKFEVRLESDLVLLSRYVLLEPYAPDTIRKFIFKEIQWINTDINWLHQEKITISVYYFNKNGNGLEFYTEFKIRIFEYTKMKEREWVISGLVSQDDTDNEYSQGITDIYKIWEKNESFDWFTLTINDYLKQKYIYACFIYNGISEEIIEKDVYAVNMSLVKEKLDFLYLAGLTFIGDRGYMGYDLYTFDDCLLTLFHKRGGYFDDKKVEMSNVKGISPDIIPLYNEIKAIFLKYKFEVLET